MLNRPPLVGAGGYTLVVGMATGMVRHGGGLFSIESWPPPYDSSLLLLWCGGTGQRNSGA